MFDLIDRERKSKYFDQKWIVWLQMRPCYKKTNHLIILIYMVFQVSDTRKCLL